MSNEEVDVAVAQDKAEAQKIYKTLKGAGIHHVDIWPQDMLSDRIGFVGHEFGSPLTRTNAHTSPHGPFHNRVPEEDLSEAQLVVSSAGLMTGE
jgi:hypothetical protein